MRRRLSFSAKAPSQTAFGMARDAAMAAAEHSYQVGVPMHLRDTHYRGADKLGNGRGYQYPHDYPGHWVAQQYMPDNLVGTRFYEPGTLGSEARIKEARDRRLMRENEQNRDKDEN